MTTIPYPNVAKMVPSILTGTVPACDIEALNHALNTCVTRYDRREEVKEIKAKRPVNFYRLAILCDAINRAIFAIDGGTSLHRALYDNFNDRLLTALERACKLPVTYGGGAQDRGRPA